MSKQSPKKVKVRLKVNLKSGPLGIIPKGRIYYDRLINLPPVIKEAVKNKNTKILDFLGEKDIPDVVVEAESPVTERSGIKPVEAPSKREVPEVYPDHNNGLTNEDDQVITPPTKPKADSQLKKRNE